MGHIDFFAGNQTIEVKGKLIKNNDNDEIKAGDTIEHKIFGIGKVLSVDGDKINVHFKRSNSKKTLMKDFAPIRKVN